MGSQEGPLRKVMEFVPKLQKAIVVTLGVIGGRLDVKLSHCDTLGCVEVGFATIY